MAKRLEQVAKAVFSVSACSNSLAVIRVLKGYKSPSLIVPPSCHVLQGYPTFLTGLVLQKAAWFGVVVFGFEFFQKKKKKEEGLTCFVHGAAGGICDRLY